MVSAPVVSMVLVALVELRESALASMVTAPLAEAPPMTLVPLVVSVPLASRMMLPFLLAVEMFTLLLSVIPAPELKVKALAPVVFSLEVSVPAMVMALPLLVMNEVGLEKVVV